MTDGYSAITMCSSVCAYAINPFWSIYRMILYCSNVESKSTFNMSTFNFLNKWGFIKYLVTFFLLSYTKGTCLRSLKAKSLIMHLLAVAETCVVLSIAPCGGKACCGPKVHHPVSTVPWAISAADQEAHGGNTLSTDAFRTISLSLIITFGGNNLPLEESTEHFLLMVLFDLFLYD